MKYIGLFIKKLLRYLLKPLSFLPAIVVMYLIFSFSSQDGVSSARLSRMVSEKVVVTADQVLEKGWSAEQIAAYTEQIHYYVRKTAHVTEYFVLAVTVAFPLYVYGIRGLWLVLLAGILRFFCRSGRIPSVFCGGQRAFCTGCGGGQHWHTARHSVGSYCGIYREKNHIQAIGTP